MKKYLTVAVLSVLLTACGGGSDSGSPSTATNTNDKPTTTNPNTTPTNPTPTVDDSLVLKINNPNVGQTLLLGSNQVTNPNIQDAINNKKYFARFTYCGMKGSYEMCSSTRLGQFSFTIVKDSDKFLVKDLNIDKLVRVTAQGSNRPEIIPMEGGMVGVAEASLTPDKNNKNQYRLKIMPASTVETRLPSIDVAVQFNDNGKNLISFNSSFMMIAQQMDNQPNNWNQDMTKNGLMGNWIAYEPDYFLQIKNKSNLSVQNNSGVEGTSNFVVSGQGTFNGYYKEMSSGYVLGYTSDNKPLNQNLSNYEGVNGFSILAPNGQYALAYDFDNNNPYKQASLLFK